MTVLSVLTIFSAALTLASFHRIRRRVEALSARARGDQVSLPQSGWNRFLDGWSPIG